ncbi:hypothetical protein PHYNN_21 [Pantoea phage Phynn]|nr:hypothetical protein PHYNN_21 [Pantoea phage Phynn]
MIIFLSKAGEWLSRVKKEVKMMNVEKYYPVLFVSNGFGDVRKIINTKAPYDNASAAIDHAYHADYPARYVEAGYAFWSGSKWVAETQEMYEEGKMDDPDFITRQEMCHREADYRLQMEAGF